MPSLCLLSDDGTPAERWDLEQPAMAVGRDASADIVVDDPALSRWHFLIVQEEDGYLLKDLGSENGTFVDGQRTQITKLVASTCIVAGRTLFMFCERQPASAMPQPAAAA